MTIQSIRANKIVTCLTVFFVLTLITVPTFAQKKKDKDKDKAPPAATPAPAAEKKEGGIQPYDKVITAKAKTDDGLFKVHKLEDKFFYEIPDSLLEREMLMVTRKAKTVDDFGYGGEEINEQVLRWQLKEKKVLLRVVSYNNVASEELPIAQSVRNSNFEP